ALAAGQGELVGARWEACGAEVAQGVGAVVLNLPDAVGGEVTVSAPRIAVSAANPAALAGVATEAAVSVRLDYENGTAADFTLDPRTRYDDVSGDPSDLFAVVADEHGVRVVPTGNGVGQATLKVAFEHTGVALTAVVNVVRHERFELASRPWPAYPGSASVSETVLSPLEGTGIWQQASLELVTVLTDDHRIDVSTRAGTTYTVVGGALEVVDVNHVHALAEGAAVVRGALGGATSGPLTMQVVSVPVVVTQVTTTFPTTFSGVVGATAQLEAAATFSDGTRQLAAHGIPGLLSYGSSVPEAAEVDESGVVTLRANHNRLVTLTASASSTSGSSDTAANLTPAVGDVDLGESVGVAHPDRSPGAMFVMPLRVNTGGAPIGALDVTVTFDPAVVRIVSVDAGAGWPGGQLDAALDNVAGEVHVVAAARAGASASGSALEVARLTFRAADGDKAETAIAGTIAKMLDNTLSLGAIGPELGPGETRAIVAGAGMLDPDCGGYDAADVRGNANGNCEFEVGDVSFTLQVLAGLVSVGGLEGYQVVALDANGDGVVTVADAVYLLRVLVGKFAFAGFEVSGAEALEDEVVLEARLADKDGAARSSGVAVFFEVGTSQSFTVSEGTDEATTANGRVVRAASAGGGVFRARLTAFERAESGIGIVPVVRTVDAEGASADDRVATFYGTPWVSELMAFVPWGTVDVEANGCFVGPCGNGTCVDLGAGAYSCTCPAGEYFDGATCMGCAEVVGCAGAVTCTMLGDSACDVCVAGRFGPTCEVCGDCEDGEECTTDLCDGVAGCVHLARTGSGCDDGQDTTYADTCDAAGACVGQAVTCPTDTVCTTYAPNGTTTCTATPTLSA
ncbi:MAG: hypothetical protein KC635_02635, partial [Myxococcales bacterium]|nr:hypothetical protein [Myxococcales bacterium]